MVAHPFHRNKMRWLNEINCDFAVSSTAFRIAFVISDFLNSITGDAWPSRRRVAARLNITTKTVQRSIAELERCGWLTVKRSKGRRVTNRYQPRWPPGCAAPLMEATDKAVPITGHTSPNMGAENVSQSFLKIPLRNYLNGNREKKSHFPDRGTFEERIIERFGPNTRMLLEEISCRSPETLDLICRAEQEGTLTSADLNAVRLFLLSPK